MKTETSMKITAIQARLRGLDAMTDALNTEILAVRDALKSAAADCRAELEDHDHDLDLRDAARTLRDVADQLAPVDFEDAELAEMITALGDMMRAEPGPANPGFCCAICGAGFDFGCRCD